MVHTSKTHKHEAQRTSTTQDLRALENGTRADVAKGGGGKGGGGKGQGGEDGGGDEGSGQGGGGDGGSAGQVQ